MSNQMHATSPGCRCKQCLLATSAALFELRDALIELSIALKDWQFEADHELRAEAELMARHLLEKIAVTPNPSRSQDR